MADYFLICPISAPINDNSFLLAYLEPQIYISQFIVKFIKNHLAHLYYNLSNHPKCNLGN